jgi:hypothetical protein
MGKLYGRRPARRPWLRWEDNIKGDSLLLLNIRGRRRLAKGRDIWRLTVEEATAGYGLSLH